MKKKLTKKKKTFYREHFAVSPLACKKNAQNYTNWLLILHEMIFYTLLTIL